MGKLWGLWGALFQGPFDSNGLSLFLLLSLIYLIFSSILEIIVIQLDRQNRASKSDFIVMDN